MNIILDVIKFKNYNYTSLDAWLFVCLHSPSIRPLALMDTATNYGYV